MLFTIIIVALLLADILALVFTVFVVNRRKQRIRISRPLFLFSVVFTVLAILFMFQLTAQLKTANSQKHWPSVMGTITSSKIIGERAFRPEIVYEYFVDDAPYSDTTNLDLPGFGGRINRLDAAEKLVEDYPAEKPVLVHYNPDNPSISHLHVGASYSTYLKLSTTAVLLLIAMYIILLFEYTRLKKPNN